MQAQFNPISSGTAARYEPSAINLSQIADTARYPKAEIISTLEQTYGRRLTEEVVAKCDALRDHVTGSEVKKLLVSVAALVNKLDLLETFSEINGSLSSKRRCLTWLSPAQFEKIRSKRSFQELDNDDLIALRNLFCKIHNGAGGSLPIGEELFPGIKGSYETAFGRHLRMVQGCELSEGYIQSAEGSHYDLRRQVAGEEHLARTISYHLPDKTALNLIVPILNEEGEPILCEVSGVYEAEGLYFYTFLPLTEGQWKQHPDSPCPVWYAFRGSNDSAAWVRNLWEPVVQVAIEAGRRSYADNEREIIKTFLSCVPRGPFKLCGAGHSLAGADSARMVKTIFSYAAKGKQGDSKDEEQKALQALQNLRELKLVTWNSASLTWDTVSSYNAARKLFKDVPVRIFHNYVDEDFVTTCGKYLLGHCIDENDQNDQPTLTKYKLLDLQTSIAATYSAHTTPLLLKNARVDILPIPQAEVNYKLGPRTLSHRLYAVCAGLFKNVWRIPSGTSLVVTGGFNMLRGRRIAQAAPSNNASANWPKEQSAPHLVVPEREVITVPDDELSEGDFVLLPVNEIPVTLLDQAQPVEILPDNESSNPAGEPACSQGSPSK